MCSYPFLAACRTRADLMAPSFQRTFIRREAAYRLPAADDTCIREPADDAHVQIRQPVSGVPDHSARMGQ